MSSIHNPTRFRFEIRQLVNEHEAGAHTLAPIRECPMCAASHGLAVPTAALRVLAEIIEKEDQPAGSQLGPRIGDYQ